ncbi:hypothetical protein GCM10027517_32540 [Phycicoccus ginsengisoli]
MGVPEPPAGWVAAEAAVCSLAPLVGVGSALVGLVGLVAEPVAVVVAGLDAGVVVLGVAGTVAVLPLGSTVVRVDGREELGGRGEDEVPVPRGVLDVEEGVGFGAGLGAAAGGAELGAPPAPKAKPITVPGAGVYAATPAVL